MSLLRVIGAFVVFIFLGAIGFFAIVGKIFSVILSALFGSTPKSPPPPRAANPADRNAKPAAPRTADNDVIEVEVISVSKEE